MILLHPTLQNFRLRLLCGLDDSEGIKKRFVGITRTGLECSPKVTIGPRVNGIKIMNRDPIPAVVWHASLGNTTRKLHLGMPRDCFAFPKLGTSVVTSPIIGDVLRQIFAVKLLIPFQGTRKCFIERLRTDTKIIIEVEVRNLLSLSICGEPLINVSG